MGRIDSTTRALVRGRAADACEYCRIPQEASPLIPFHVEHVTPKQHGGSDDPAQLAFACDRCNAYKGTNLAGIDPDTGAIVPLFNPRRDSWMEHFSVRGPEITGLTATGRATVRLLKMNARRRVELREEWLRDGGLL